MNIMQSNFQGISNCGSIIRNYYTHLKSTAMDFSSITNINKYKLTRNYPHMKEVEEFISLLFLAILNVSKLY